MSRSKSIRRNRKIIKAGVVTVEVKVEGHPRRKVGWTALISGSSSACWYRTGVDSVRGEGRNFIVCERKLWSNLA